MALFGSKKKNDQNLEAAPGGGTSRHASSMNAGTGVAAVLRNPRITEKASMKQGVSAYTFDVATNATKPQIASAVRSVYKVTPRKIRIVAIPSKTTRSMRTGRTGVRSGGKKAYVYLKSGETITIS